MHQGNSTRKICNQNRIDLLETATANPGDSSIYFLATISYLKIRNLMSAKKLLLINSKS